MPRNVYDVLIRIAAALERIESRVPSTVAHETTPRQSLLARAIAIAIEHGITNKAEIARRLGVHRSNLTKLRKLNAVLDNIRRYKVFD
jgi:ActR/RegA family two-component response regulator